MTVAEIHAASGFSQPAVEETEPALSYAPTLEPEPATAPMPPFDPSTSSGSSRAESRDDSRETTARSGLPPWEADPLTSPMLPTWDEPVTPPVLPPFDPSTSSGSSQSRDDSAHGSVTGLEEFLKAILRARAGRDAVR